MRRVFFLFPLSLLFTLLNPACEDQAGSSSIQGTWKGTGKDKGTVITFDKEGYYHLSRNGTKFTGQGEDPSARSDMTTVYEVKGAEDPSKLSIISVKGEEEKRTIGKGAFTQPHPDTLLIRMNLGFEADYPEKVGSGEKVMKLYRSDGADQPV